MRHRAVLAIPTLAILFSAAPLLANHRGGFELAVLVDGCEAPEYEGRGKIYVEAIRGKTFALRLSNPTSERVAVALSVDGRNVVDAKHKSALDATKWILDAFQTIEIPGWQVSGETARKFFFTETSRSYAKWLGDTRNVGTIEAVVFRERRPEPAPIAGGESRANEPLRVETAEPLRSAREGAPAEGAGAAPKSGTDRRDESDRLAATGIGERTRFPVRWVNFEEDPEPVARIALRYEFRKELVRLGVLPRGDDALAAREGARGFAPRYAPDPDRER